MSKHLCRIVLWSIVVVIGFALLLVGMKGILFLVTHKDRGIQATGYVIVLCLLYVEAGIFGSNLANAISEYIHERRLHR